MKRLLSLVVVLLTTALVSTPAGAQSIGDVEEELRADQVYVEDGAEGSEPELRSIVADAADRGLDLYIVSIRGSNTDTESLAQSLRDRLGGTVLVVTPSSIGAASSTLAEAETNRGLDAFSGSIEQGAAGFLDAVAPASASAVDSSSTPSSNSAGSAGSDGSDGADSSGGSGWGVAIFFLVVIGLIVALVMFVRSRNRKKVKDEMGVRRAQVTDELGEIGKEILALADRVTLADDAAATTHFRQGNEQYLELQEQLDAATSLWEVTQVDYAADTAAWHLDAAEALLDGEDVPAEPERPDLTVSRPPAKDAPSPQATEVEPSRRVEPRQRRRTQWDPPTTRGGGLGDLLTGVLVGDVLRGGRRTGRRAPGGWSGGGSLGGVFGSGSGGGRRAGGFGGSSGSRSRGSSGSRRR